MTPIDVRVQTGMLYYLCPCVYEYTCRLWVQYVCDNSQFLIKR